MERLMLLLSDKQVTSTTNLCVIHLLEMHAMCARMTIDNSAKYKVDLGQ